MVVCSTGGSHALNATATCGRVVAGGVGGGEESGGGAGRVSKVVCGDGGQGRGSVGRSALFVADCQRRLTTHLVWAGIHCLHSSSSLRVPALSSPPGSPLGTAAMQRAAYSRFVGGVLATCG